MKTCTQPWPGIGDTNPPPGFFSVTAYTLKYLLRIELSCLEHSRVGLDTRTLALYFRAAVKKHLSDARVFRLLGRGLF